MKDRSFRQQSKPVKFMGQDFPALEEFRRAYPAFSSDDAVRALREGCDTVMAVERFCWARRNKGRLASIAAAQRSQFSAKFGRQA